MSTTTPLPTLNELLTGYRGEIELYYQQIKDMKGQDIPDHIKQLAGIHARVSEIRNEIAPSKHETITKFRIQEVDPMLRDCLEFQFKCWSRLVTTIEADYRMSKGTL